MVKVKKLFAITLSSVLILIISACSTQPATDSTANISAPTTQSSQETVAPSLGSKAAKEDKELSTEEMLTYAIQDEYLAHAEYDYILTTFGNQNPFSNIIKAEETHIGLLEPLFQKSSLAVPQDDASKYVPHPASIQEALKVGVQAEIDNIAMYEIFLSKDISADLKAAFTELRDASKNHLNAFNNKLNKY